MYNTHMYMCVCVRVCEYVCVSKTKAYYNFNGSLTTCKRPIL